MVLIIQLVRMHSGHGGSYRGDTLVEVPRLGLEACGAVYDLVAQILHSGIASTGHYTARVLRFGLWWLCDDGNVRRCPKQKGRGPGWGLLRPGCYQALSSLARGPSGVGRP